jgi:ligand-binding sensor domain-containing protein
MSGQQGWGKRWRKAAGSVLLLALLCPLPALAGYQTPRMHRIGPTDGLPSRVVLQLEQDRRGYVWAATEDGLVRMDGTGLRVWQHNPDDALSLPVNYIESLTIDAADRVWVGTNGGGLLRMRTDGRGFEPFPQVTQACGEQVWSLETLAETVWVGSNGQGICLLAADGSLRRLAVGDGAGQLPNGQIYSLRVDTHGRMWIGTGDGLLRWEGGRLQAVGTATLAGKTITRISLDRDDQVWVSSNEQLWRLRGDDQLVEVTGPTGNALRSAAVLDDSGGGRWIGTANGLYRQDSVTDTMQLLDGDAGSGFLGNNSAVLDMLRDREGGVWFATLSQGLAYLPPDWKRFSTRYRLGEQLLESLYLVNSAADGDGFLVGGGHGVYRLDGQGRLQQLASTESMGGGAVWSLLPLANGQILLGRGGRLTRIDRQGRLLGHIALGTGADPYNRVDLMMQAADGSLWMKVMGVGLQQRDAQGRLLRQLRYGGPEGLVDRTISQLRQAPDGSLWIATEGGVLRFDGQSVRPVEGIAADFRAHDLVFAYRQLVWVASDGLIARYQWDGGKVTLQERIDHQQGVPPVEIGGLLLGDSGQLWATTPRGLLHWNGRGRVRMYGVRDGLPDVEFSGRPPSRNARRGLAISSAGLVHFDLDLPPAVLPAAQLVIDAAQVRDEGSPRPRMLDISGRQLQLGPDDRDLLITARLLSYAQPDTHQYRFRVHGLDRDWVEVGAEGSRMLPRVPAGEHRIEVQARSAQGPWSASEILQLQVQPVWWASGTARLLWAALLLLGGLLLVQARPGAVGCACARPG